MLTYNPDDRLIPPNLPDPLYCELCHEPETESHGILCPVTFGEESESYVSENLLSEKPVLVQLNYYKTANKKTDPELYKRIIGTYVSPFFGTYRKHNIRIVVCESTSLDNGEWSEGSRTLSSGIRFDSSMR